MLKTIISSLVTGLLQIYGVQSAPIGDRDRDTEGQKSIYYIIAE